MRSFPARPRLVTESCRGKTGTMKRRARESNRLVAASRLRYSGGEYMATDVSKRLFTVHDYHRMVDAGILTEDDRVELIRGEILAMSPIGSPHNGSVLRASNGLFALVGGQAIVSVQGAVRLDLYSEAQPD